MARTRQNITFPAATSAHKPYFAAAWWQQQLSARTVAERDGCWRWQGLKLSLGYPVLYVRAGGKPSRVGLHQVALWLREGVYTSAQKKQHACHTCNQTWCCNPSHLYLGNAKTNKEDRVRRHIETGVPAGCFDDYASRRALTDEQVTQARALFYGPLGNAKGEVGSGIGRLTPTKIALAFNVSVGRIRNLAYGVTSIENFCELDAGKKSRLLEAIAKYQKQKSGEALPELRYTATYLAKLYGVGVRRMLAILKNERYRHLPMPKEMA